MHYETESVIRKARSAASIFMTREKFKEVYRKIVDSELEEKI